MFKNMLRLIPMIYTLTVVCPETASLPFRDETWHELLNDYISQQSLGQTLSGHESKRNVVTYEFSRSSIDEITMRCECDLGEIALFFARRLVLFNDGGKHMIISSRDFMLPEVWGGDEKQSCPRYWRREYCLPTLASCVCLYCVVLHLSWTGNLIWRNISLQCLPFRGGC